jgi:hypothetical protein
MEQAVARVSPTKLNRSEAPGEAWRIRRLFGITSARSLSACSGFSRARLAPRRD